MLVLRRYMFVARPSPAPAPAASHFSMTTRVVLLVTAEQGFAAHATAVLTTGGYVVLIVRTVHEAIDAVVRLTPDVVLLDGRRAPAAAGGGDLRELARRTAHAGTRGFVVSPATADLFPAAPFASWSRLEWNPAELDLSGSLSLALADHVTRRPVTPPAGRRETAPRS